MDNKKIELLHIRYYTFCNYNITIVSQKTKDRKVLFTQCEKVHVIKILTCQSLLIDNRRVLAELCCCLQNNALGYIQRKR